MKHLVTICAILLSTFYVSFTNADEPKASSPIPRVNNVWGAKNEWIRAYQRRQAASQQTILSRNFRVSPYPQMPPSRSYNYYNRPVIIQNYSGCYPMYYNYRNGIYYYNNGYGRFWMNFSTNFGW